jgi:hypothetical protein
MAGVLGKLYIKLLDSGQYSDFIISCKNVDFKVHRAVVCTGSPMLAAACNGTFEVQNSPPTAISL